jgi:hypothetical protein
MKPVLSPPKEKKNQPKGRCEGSCEEAGEGKVGGNDDVTFGSGNAPSPKTFLALSSLPQQPWRPHTVDAAAGDGRSLNL